MVHPVPVPTQKTGGTTLRVVDYMVRTAHAVSEGPTIATVVEFDAPEGNYLWRVERLAVACTDTGDNVHVHVYAGAIAPAYLRDNTVLTSADPQQEGFRVDQSEYPSYLNVDSNAPLIITFGGAAAGSRCMASAQFQLVWRAPAATGV